jgi:large subunit ribosomal protein L25
VEFRIQVEARDGSGRTPCRRLRNAGKVPAVIYGGGQAPSSVSLDLNSLSHQMEHEAFYTSILTLEVGKDTQPVIVKDVQRHPTRPQVLHLDFQRIVADEEITLNVPLHFTGEDSAAGVKLQGGVVEHLMSDVEVSCLPKDLPAFLEIDVSEVELNQIVHLSDIPLPAGVTLVALEHGSDQPVFTIAPPRREEVEEEIEEELPEGAAPEVPTIESEEGESSD